MRMLFLLLALAPLTAAAQHAHGVAELAIGVDGLLAEVRFTASAEDVYGFEREPRTEAERAKKAAAFKTLREQGAALLQFDAALNCAVSVVTVEDRRDPRQASHLEVQASYRVVCRKPLAKSRLRLGVTTLFPGVTRVKVTLLTESGATTKTLGRGDFLEL